MKTAIYSRKSVYRESGESLENQVALCRQYLCMQYGEAEAAAAEVFEDEGVSAKNLARAELQRMLRAVRAGEIGRIVCYRLDRISRNVCDFTALLEGLERRGVEIVCIREKFDTSTPMGKAMLYIASVFAQLERETISERVRDTMLWMARGGRWLGGQPPYGYAAVRLHWPEGTGREKYASFLREEPAESRVVRRIFREYLRFGEIGAVRASLCRAGVWSRTGKAFSAQAIRAILQNPAYCRRMPHAMPISGREARRFAFCRSGCRRRGSWLITSGITGTRVVAGSGGGVDCGGEPASGTDFRTGMGASAGDAAKRAAAGGAQARGGALCG